MSQTVLIPPNFKDVVRSFQLSSLLDQYPQIKVLSLDCFDTLVWRKTATPQDMFFAMQEHPIFKQLGMTAQARHGAEARVIQFNLLKSISKEANLRDIYLENNPEYTESEINQLTQAEIETEIEYSFSLILVVNLIREAYKRKIKIIIVSDTYYLKAQLLEIIKKISPPDIIEMINEVFCSSEYGRTKLKGLFEYVVRKMQVDPTTILHIGDNYVADYVSARTFSIKALHFIQQDQCIENILRLHTTVANIFDHKTRTTKPLLSLFKGIFTQQSFAETKPESLIGYASLGPIIYSFADYILKEIEKLKKTEKKLKVVFLMRDAFLPSLACEALLGENIGHLIRVNRFSSVAASFRTEEDILRYLIMLGKTNRYYDVGRQLLLPQKVLEPIIKVANRSPEPELTFLQEIKKKEIVRIIINKSAEFRKRLFFYLKKETDMQAGDTLLLIDLGYSGSVQKILTPLLREMDITVIGRYLISLSAPGAHLNCAGLIDTSWCDIKTLRALVTYIAGFEQLCTANESSVIDYDEKGNVIYSNTLLSKEQHQQLTQIQSEALRFVVDAKEFFQNIHKDIPASELRASVIFEIARMLFLPTASELNYLKNFNFDFNLGTEEVFKLFDPDQGLAGLRKRGLFFMEHSTKTKRTNYPAELRVAGFELALTHLIQNRFHFEITPHDILARQEKVTVVLKNGQEIDEVLIEANATYEGYYALCVPVGTGVSFKFGKHYQFVEIDSIEQVSMQHFLHQNETSHTEDILSCIHLEKMQVKSGQLYECESVQAQAVYLPDQSKNTRDQVLRVIFRPIVKQVSLPSKPTKNKHGYKVSFNINI